jgi:hypothetical protein
VPSAAESKNLNASAEPYISADVVRKFISLGTADSFLSSYNINVTPRVALAALSQKGDLVDSLDVQRVYAGNNAADSQPYTMADFT